MRGRRFNPSTIVGKSPDPVKANQSDQLEFMRQEFMRRMKAKDAEIERKDAEIKRVRDALDTFAFRVEYMTEELSRYTALFSVKQRIQREIQEARAALSDDAATEVRS